VWLFVSIAFAILGYVPSIKDSLDHQTLIVGVLVIPFATLGAAFYYKSGSKGSGVIIGLTMAVTALLLDALITVPFIEIPNGGSYQRFFSYPLLWLLVAVNMVTVYFYAWLKPKH